MSRSVSDRLRCGALASIFPRIARPDSHHANEANGRIAMENLHFVFASSPASPTASSPLSEVMAWSLWRATRAGVRDLLFEESGRGLCVKHFVEEKATSRCAYEEVACFPHLRGTPLHDLPSKGGGTAVNGAARWKLRFWTGVKAENGPAPACTLVQLVPFAEV
jgi:hypothetical protein